METVAVHRHLTKSQRCAEGGIVRLLTLTQARQLTQAQRRERYNVLTISRLRLEHQDESYLPPELVIRIKELVKAINHELEVLRFVEIREALAIKEGNVIPCPFFCSRDKESIPAKKATK